MVRGKGHAHFPRSSIIASMALHQKIFFFLLVLLPTQLGYHAWPEWAHVLGRRVDYLSPIIYLTDVLLIATMASWFVENFFHKFSIFNLKFLINRRKFIFLIFKLGLLFVFIGINIFVSSSRPVAMYTWFKVLEFVGLGFYVIKTRPPLSLLAYYLSLGVLYSSILAMAQFFLQRSVGGPLWFLGERTFAADTPGISRLSWCLIPGSWCRELLRPYATFPHPNVLGGYLAAILPLLIFNSKFEIPDSSAGKLNQTRKFLIFKFLIIILGMIALLLTFSRSAWIAGAGAIIFTIARIRNYELRIMKSRKYVIFVFFFILYSLFILHRSVNESVVVRLALNKAAISMWETSPLFGVGAGNFLVRLPDALPSRGINFLQPVHNVYLLVFAEIGIVGLVGFAWIIWKAIPFGRRDPRGGKNQRDRALRMAYHMPLFTLLVLGLVDHYPLTLQQGQLLLALFLGLSFSSARPGNR